MATRRVSAAVASESGGVASESGGIASEGGGIASEGGGAASERDGEASESGGEASVDQTSVAGGESETVTWPERVVRGQFSYASKSGERPLFV